MPVKTDAPVYIPLSNEERNTGILSDVHLYDAINGFFKDGVVVLENAIPTDIIDSLNDRMKVDTDRIMAGEIKDIHWKWVIHRNVLTFSQGIERGNVSQVPPMEEAYLFPEIYANKAAAKVMTNIFGPRPELRYVRSNTLVGNTTMRQSVHKDIKGRHLPHPCAIALNICLIDTTPENGATELWLGTQTDATWDDYEDPTLKLGWVKAESLEKRRTVRPPVYASLKKGSLVLRDTRLWHAGMPNSTQETRVMLAFVYTAAWYKNGLLPPWPREFEAKIKALGDNNGTYIAGDYNNAAKDYLAWKFDGAFSSTLETGA